MKGLALHTLLFVFSILINLAKAEISNNQDDARKLSEILSNTPGVSSSVRTWDELKKLFGDSTLSKEELNYRICSEEEIASTININGHRKRIFGVWLFWNEYQFADKSICVKLLLNKDRGFLDASGTELLLTLKDERNYMKTGIVSGIRLHFHYFIDLICNSHFINFHNVEDNLKDSMNVCGQLIK